MHIKVFCTLEKHCINAIIEEVGGVGDSTFRGCLVVPSFTHTQRGRLEEALKRLKKVNVLEWEGRGKVSLPACAEKAWP